jgi:hypothetical protein
MINLSALTSSLSNAAGAYTSVWAFHGRARDEKFDKYIQDEKKGSSRWWKMTKFLEQTTVENRLEELHQLVVVLLMWQSTILAKFGSNSTAVLATLDGDNDVGKDNTTVSLRSTIYYNSLTPLRWRSTMALNVRSGPKKHHHTMR